MDFQLKHKGLVDAQFKIGFVLIILLFLYSFVIA